MVQLSPWNLCLPDSYARNVLLLLFIFPPFSFAAPIRDSSEPSNWLACLTALLIFSVICLSTFKILFVRHRKFINLRGPPPVHRQCLSRSMKLFKFSAYACKSDENCKAGFLIGLFGSPSFEIRSKPSDLTLIYGEDTSGSSQKHDVSGDTVTTYKTKSSTLSTGPIVLFNNQTPSHIHKYNNRPSRFSPSLTKSTISRFLHSQLSFDLGRIGRKKGHVEVSASRESLPWPHNHLEHTTLRLVKLYTEPEASLPFYTDPGPIPGLASPQATHGFTVAHLNRSCLSPVSYLPSLPTRSPDVEDHMPVASLSDKRADHPYNNALLPLVKPGRHRSRRASLSPNLSVIEEICHVSVSNLPGSTNGQTGPTCDNMKSPLTIFSAYDNLKRREKSRPSTLRTRRSPPLGPSPLRSMILPDIVESDHSVPGCTTVNEIKGCPVPRRKPLQYHRVGLGIPSVKLSPPDKEGIKSQDCQENTSEGNTGSKESMLDFLRELAEETREWDESIVLDEGFRNMIQRSQAILGCTSLENVNIKCSTPKIPPGSDGNKTSPKFVSFWLEDSPSP